VEIVGNEVDETGILDVLRRGSSINDYHLDDYKKEVKYWYDGFNIGKRKDIYNPWSIINFLKFKELSAYWIHTSSNKLVDELIKQGSASLKINFEKLLNHETIEVSIDEQISFEELNKKENNVYSLLVTSGYLKIVSKKEDKYELSITNHEVRQAFRKMIEGWFNDDNIKPIYNEFIKALLNHEVEYMNAILERIMIDTSIDQKYPEKFYHGFILELIMSLNKDYIIKSHRESGFSRYDIMIYSKDFKKGYIMEFKTVNKFRKETLEIAVNEALKQIEEKEYETELKSIGISKIYKYGFAFEGKKVLIK